jgi:VIT1/CCC1 family predicted Fe2+/Mn2+ transporter
LSSFSEARSYVNKLYNIAMTLDALIMLAGAFVAVLPSLGFPNSWDNVLFFLAGIFIISLGIIVRRRAGHSTHPKSEISNMEDNSPRPPTHEST